MRSSASPGARQARASRTGAAVRFVAVVVAGFAALAVAGLAGCSDSGSPGGEGPEESCAISSLTYENFGAAFIADWCRGCHSSQLPGDMRQSSPPGVNFDDAAAVRAAQERIAARSLGSAPTMPPAGGPGPAERDLLAEWIRCGAR